MKKYLFTWLLGLLSLLGYAQGDIPIKESVTSPPLEFLRPILRPHIGEIEYRKADGSYWNGRKQRDPKLFYTWPPYLIESPVQGDQAMGPSASADTSLRQYAVFNGTRWIEYGQVVPEPILFGKGLSKAGNTVIVSQYPASLGDILADRLSLGNAPVKATDPQQHSFIVYNPTTGTLERIPYGDILSAMGVKQWPYSLGKVGVDALYWSTVPSLVSAENLNLSNARFLMQLGNSTVAMSMGEYKVLLEKSFGLNLSGRSLQRVAAVANQTAPGEVGHYFLREGKMHLNIEKDNGQNAWIRWAVDTVFSYNLVPSSPAPVLAYTGNPTPTSLSLTWTYAGSPTGFTLYASRNDTLNYQAVATIAAGARSYTLTNAIPNSTYHLRLQALTASGTSPLSNRVVATTSPVDNFTQWPNVRNVVIKQSGPQQFRIEFDTYEDGGGVRFEISKKANPNPAADGDYTFAAGKPLGAAGHYELYVDGITDSEVRNFRFRRESSSADGKTPSSYGAYGPVSIQGSGVTVNTPAIISTTDVTSTSVKLNLNYNNSNVAKAWLYQSLASVQNFTRIEIPVSSSTYTVTGLQPGTKYLFHIQVSKMDGTTEVFSPNSTPETEVTTLGDNSNNVCSFSTTASGGYEATTKTFTMAHTGKVYFMLDAGQIPDQLTVKKNGTIVANPYAASWRTAGSVDVVAGDVIEFIINPKVTGDMGTGWTLYANCSTPYNVDTPQANNNYGNRDFPHITSVARSTSGTRTYTITATPARATGTAIVGYKAVRAIRSFRADEGWSSSNVISKDQVGEEIYGDESYVIYVKDANGKMYGIAGITSGGSYPEDIPAANPVQFNLSNITSAQATINVTNAAGGTKNYGWAVYRGDYTQQGSEFMGYFGGPVPSSGTFTVTIAGGPKTLVPGTTYRMYVNQSDNPDATRNWVEFTVPKPTDPPPASTGTLKASAYSTSN